MLHWKKPLHRWVDKLGERDFEIIVRFVLITLVILPVLPNKSFGPYDIFNPFTAWLLVVLIVAINLVGFILFRLVGARAGGWLAGLVGGLVSSTATTISYAGMSKRQRNLAPVAALVILVLMTIFNIIAYVWPYQAALPKLTYKPAFMIRQTSFMISNVIPMGGAFGIAVQYAMLNFYGIGPGQATAGIGIVSACSESSMFLTYTRCVRREARLPENGSTNATPSTSPSSFRSPKMTEPPMSICPHASRPWTRCATAASIAC